MDNKIIETLDRGIKFLKKASKDKKTEAVSLIKVFEAMKKKPKKERWIKFRHGSTLDGEIPLEPKFKAEPEPKGYCQQLRSEVYFYLNNGYAEKVPKFEMRNGVMDIFDKYECIGTIPSRKEV